MIDIQLNLPYHGKIDSVSFGDIPEHMLIEKYRNDGRKASIDFELLIPLLHDCLIQVKGDRKYDFIINPLYTGNDRVLNSNKKFFDQKMVTKNGSMFAPSGQKGIGRTFDKLKAYEQIAPLILIFVDATKFPNYFYVFKDGAEMIQRFPNFKFAYDQWKDVLYDGTKNTLPFRQSA